MSMLHVILAEDHNIVRSGIRALLESNENLKVVGEATNGQQVVDILNKGEKVDIVLADINMPVMDGFSLIRQLKDTHPKTSVIMLSMLDNEKYVCQAFQEGAHGYLLKSIGPEELIFALRHVADGGKYLCSELSIRFVQKAAYCSANLIADPESKIEFSSREIEVLNLIAEGLTNAEMSGKLFISKRTVEGHRQSLIEKTGSRNTATLIKYAVLNGLIH